MLSVAEEQESSMADPTSTGSSSRSSKSPFVVETALASASPVGLHASEESLEGPGWVPLPHGRHGIHIARFLIATTSHLSTKRSDLLMDNCVGTLAIRGRRDATHVELWRGTISDAGSHLCRRPTQTHLMRRTKFGFVRSPSAASQAFESSS